MRAKGLALSAIIINAIGFINQFCTPIALESIQYRYIFMYVAFDVAAASSNRGNIAYALTLVC